MRLAVLKSLVLSAFRGKLNLFYLLAFIPLFLILHYNIWTMGIAFYAFVFLLLKDHKLHSFGEASSVQRILGLIVMLSSFFVYYALTLIVPEAGFYGGANYMIYILGLFLIFFNLRALKEAFTPIFFIAAATYSYILAEWVRPFFLPFLDDIAYIILNILRALRVNSYVFHSGGVPIISLTSVSGKLVLTSFVYECIGVFSALVFSIILVIILLEDSRGWKIRVLASVIGIVGTFCMNIVRITAILLTDYFYGVEVGAIVHYFIGYVLFSAWLAFFLYAYFKSKTMKIKIPSIPRKISFT